MKKSITKKILFYTLPLIILIFSIIVVYPISYFSYHSNINYFIEKEDNLLLEALKISILYEPLNAVYNNLTNLSVNNNNDNEISNFDPFLPVEDIEERMNKPDYLFQNDKKNSENKVSDKIVNESVNNKLFSSSGKNSMRYFKSESILNKPKIYRIIDMNKLDKSNFLLRGYKNSVVQSTPIYKDGNLYFSTSENSIISYNLKNDKVNWKRKFPVAPAKRGMIIEEIDSSSTLFFNVSDYVVSIDADSGDFLEDFGNSGFVKIGVGSTNPIIVGDNLITSTNSPNSSIVSLNKKTGEINWKTSMRDKTFNDGAAPWAGFSVKDSIIYAATGNPRPALYGANRKGENKFSNSIVALNLISGDVTWHFQETSHGLWDLDISSTPLVHDGRVIVPTKRGNLLVLNSITGKFIGDYNMRRAPTSDVPGEKTSEYQLNIINPVPFSQDFKKSDLRKDINLNDYNYGFYATPSLKKPLIMYGIHGGATWPGASINNNQIVFGSNRTPWKLRLYLQSNHLPRIKEFSKIYNTYQNKCISCHGPQRNGNYSTYGQVERNYVPSLVGIEYTGANSVMKSKEKFLKLHNFEISDEELANLREYFVDIDKQLLEKDHIYMRSVWTMFYDEDYLPITNPPWSEIISYDLNSLKIKWRTPIGTYLDSDEITPTGQLFHGGLATSSDGLIYATGTPDKYIRSYDINNGTLKWEYKMLNAGSSPPLLFIEDGKSYLAVISTGGIYYDYLVEDGPKSLYIFEL